MEATPHTKNGGYMNQMMMEELIQAAAIPDNDAAVTTLLETLRQQVDRDLYLALENAINLRVAEMQSAAFAAGMVAGASGLDIQWHAAETSADLEALRKMLGDALWRQRVATINGEDTAPAGAEVGAILAEYRQKRRRLEALGRVAWGDLPGYVK